VAPEFACPRCGLELQPPTLMHREYLCSAHGPVAPLQRAVLPHATGLRQVASRSAVPMWIPWPLPATWLFTGVRVAEGTAAEITATAVGFTGQEFDDGPTDMIIVAEKPGTGLGAHLAGLEHVDPPAMFVAEPATTTVHAAGWATPLWSIPSQTDRSVYVGEASGEWLWLITWPQSGWSVVHSDLRLRDLRDGSLHSDIPTGALMPRLSGLR